jgi:tRNA threonylcarbamoyladenosine biosynthesis protein TsaB
MLILSLDTSGDICSVALSDDARLLSALEFRHERHLSERLPAIVAFLLQDRGLRLAEVEGFGVGLGPGSFTGVRIGVTFAKTLAFAAGKPVVGVSSLDALAEAVARLSGLAIAAVAPTRRTEVVAAFYRPGHHIPVLPARVTPNVDVIAEARTLLGLEAEAPLLVVGEAAGAIQRDSESTLGAAHFHILAPSATAVARITADRFERGEIDDVDLLTPLYVTPTPVG